MSVSNSANTNQLCAAARHWALRLHPRDEAAAADLQQDLALAVCAQRGRYDSARGSWSTFATRVARNAAFMHRDEARAAKRGGRADHVALDDDHLPDGLAPDADLVREVRRAVAALPEADRAVCALLVDEPVASAARDLGMSRAALRRRIERIRERFEAAGLGAWLEAA